MALHFGAHKKGTMAISLLSYNALAKKCIKPMFAVPAQLYILVQKMQINFISDSQSRYFHVGFGARQYGNAVQLLVGLFGETAKELKA